MKNDFLKRMLAVLTVTAIISSSLLFTVCAENDTDEYDLWIGGERVSGSSLSGDGWTYDPESARLTLEDASVSGTYEYQPWYEAMIYSGMSDLTIELKGDNLLKSDNPYADGIDAAGGCNITVTGDGSLTVDHAYYGFYIGSWDISGGDIVFDGATITVNESEAAGIWVNHDMTFNNSKVTVVKTNESYNGIVSNVDGTITVTDSDVSVTANSSAVHMGNTDNSAHRLILNSGSLTLSSVTGFGIFVQPEDTTEIINGSIQINGGTLTADSASGATNIPLENVTIAESHAVTAGNDLHDAGVVTVSAAVTFKPGDINGDNSVDNKDVSELFRYLTGQDADVEEIALDCSGDGLVNNKDVTLLFRYISGGYGVLLSDKPYENH